MLSPKDLKDLFSESSPDKVVQKAQRLASKGRPDQALQLLKEGVERLGEGPELRTEMATLLLSAGRTREAAEALRALLKGSASWVPRVEEYIGWARTQYSDVGLLWEALAEGHIARRSFAAALDCLERLDKKSLEALVEARLSNLNRFLGKSSAVPKSATATLYLAALSYEALGDWHKAADCYRKILAASASEMTSVDDRLRTLTGRHYKATSLRLVYAEILETAGRHDRAREEYLKALEVDPRCAPQVGQFLDEQLKAAPEDQDLLWARAGAHMTSGATAEALEVFGRLIDARSHLTEIEKTLEDLSAAGKESVEIQLMLARLAAAQGKAARAVSAVVAAIGNDAGQKGAEELERIRAQFPEEPRPYQILADLHLKEGRISQCLEIYRTLRSVDPSSSSMIATRLQAVLMTDPDNKAVREMLEEVCVASGDPRAAVPFLRHRLRDAPGQAGDVLEQLRPLLLSNPEDPALKMAAAEAALAAGEPSTAWGHIQDLIDASRPPDGDLLHMIVVCGGSSAELHGNIASFVSSLKGRWSGRPEVTFALAEAAGRAGLLKEAVRGLREAASAAPEGAAICRDAMRHLAPAAVSASGEDRAAVAEALMEMGNFTTATSVLRGARDLPAAAAIRLMTRLSKALKANPKNIELSLAMTGVCLAAGQVPRALEVARAGLAGREDAASGPLALAYAEALVRSGKLAEATQASAAAVKRDPGLVSEVVERLRRIIQIDLGQETAHLALGKLLISIGQVCEGVNELMTAWSIKADLGPVILKDFEKVALKNPGDTSLDFARSQLLLGIGDPVAAVECIAHHTGNIDLVDEILARLDAIVTRHPKCARAHLELGRASLVKKWVARACSCLTRAIELQPAFADAVLVALSQAQKEHPDEPAVPLALGALYEASGRPIPAAEVYMAAAKLEDRAGPAVAALEKLRSRAHSGEPQAAPRIHLICARVHRAHGRIDEAIAAIQGALGAGSDGAEAMAEIDPLLEVAPHSAGARLARAEALLRMQKLEEAVQELSAAVVSDRACAGRVADLARAVLERAPGMASAALARADALAATGRLVEAAGALDEALASPQGAKSLELILARRSLALAAGDPALAGGLLGRAERTARDRDELLDRLHRDALRTSGGAAAESAPLQSLARGDHLAAAAAVAGEPPSPLKAWVLERCGLTVEAAACLREILDAPGAESRYVQIHNEIVARELEGRPPALTALTAPGFGPGADQGIALRVARGAAHGGSK